MGANFSSDVVSTLIDTNTKDLITNSDNIVRNCSGTNCNTSVETRNKIISSNSTLAQKQAYETLNTFSIPNNSVLGQQVFNNYLDLGSAVSTSYVFQCGSTTINSTSCVNNSQSVQNAQNNLRNILNEPATNNINHLIILSIIWTLGIIFSILFLVFFIIGLFEWLFNRGKYDIETKQVIVNPTSSQTVRSTQIALPASPFSS